MSEKVKASLSVGTIIGLVSLALAIAGGVAALMGSIYCTKSELSKAKEEVTKEVIDVKLKAEQQSGKTAIQDWKLQTVQVQMQNIEQRQIQQSENIEKLLGRFRVQPVEKPAMKPLPAPPDLEVFDGSNSNP